MSVEVLFPGGARWLRLGYLQRAGEGPVWDLYGVVTDDSTGETFFVYSRTSGPVESTIFTRMYADGRGDYAR